MNTLILEPEFYVDFDGSIGHGCITIDNQKIIALGGYPQNPGKKIRLQNQVIMPGFVNCHSHVFQRMLRGLVEKSTPEENKNNFWTWRQKMYRIAQNITKDEFLAIAELTYLEMLEAGFTHVGEFHYLHHNVGGLLFDDPLTMSRAVSCAAKNTGINLSLLECAYHQYSFSEPLHREQQRFAFNRVIDFIKFVQDAKNALDDNTVNVGVAIHSIRAVPETWYAPINDFALKNDLPLHIHISEQLQEVEMCLKEKSCSPIALLNKNHLLAPHTTLVHATHLINDDIALIGTGFCNICICPSTEKNLGDGVIKLNALHQRGVPICLGTDQHVRLDPFGEARSLEEQERLRLRRRGILSDHDYLYKPLLKSLTQYGMASLYPTKDHHTLLGKNAHLIAIELPPEYLWHGPKIALEAIMLAYNPSKITTVITNGHFVIQDSQLIFKDKQYLINKISTFIKNLFLS
jgi:formimidoylglutamate deiminase